MPKFIAVINDSIGENRIKLRARTIQGALCEVRERRINRLRPVSIHAADDYPVAYVDSERKRGSFHTDTALGLPWDGLWALPNKEGRR